MAEQDLDVFIHEQNTIADLHERIDLLERQKAVLLVRTEILEKQVKQLTKELEA